jgi:hypothetical protein
MLDAVAKCKHPGVRWDLRWSREETNGDTLARKQIRDVLDIRELYEEPAGRCV